MRARADAAAAVDIMTEPADPFERPPSEEILRLFYDLPFIGMAVTSPVTKRWVRVNQTLCDILGYSREALVGMSWAEVTHPEDLDATMAEFERVMRGEIDGYKIDKRYIRRDGSTVYATVDVKCLRGPDGGVDFFVATIADTTEQRRAERALVTSQARLAEAQRLARIGSWDLDVGTGTLGWSEEVFRIFELAPAGFTPTYEAFLAQIHPEDRARVHDAFTASLRDRQPYRLAHRLQMPDGRIKHVEEQCESVFAEDGRPLRSIGTVQDITDRVAAESARERLIAELEQRNAELERFTYTVSHDLRSPLITIRGFVGSLERDFEEGRLDRVREDLGRIATAATRMEELLSDLLELSRVGHAAGTPEAVPLDEAAREAVSLAAGALGHADVRIAPGLPRVQADRMRVVELLQNLVENAGKYRQPGRGLRVEIGATRHDAVVTGFVRDNGSGIDPRYHETVFGLFNKLNAKSEGSGVGLALARRIVEVHGGRLWVESAGEGEGAAFCFTLPAAGGEGEA
ncbi:MAG: PAS domain-containing protein [Vicinamibacterales bacterium]|nr:PAS domain-containing protein [Vicinamibacterales bacterium]